MRPGPAPARSARRETARSSVPGPAPAIQGPWRPVPGSLLTTPLRTTAGTGSQRSETWTATATSARRPSGGQRIEGVAAIAIDGGRVSRTSTRTVSGALETCPSSTTRVTIDAPRGSVTFGRGPVASPNAPVQRYESVSPSGSDEALPSSVTPAPSGPAHSAMRSGPASAAGAAFDAPNRTISSGPAVARRRGSRTAERNERWAPPSGDGREVSARTSGSEPEPGSETTIISDP